MASFKIHSLDAIGLGHSKYFTKLIGTRRRAAEEKKLSDLLFPCFMDGQQRMNHIKNLLVLSILMSSLHVTKCLDYY